MKFSYFWWFDFFHFLEAQKIAKIKFSKNAKFSIFSSRFYQIRSCFCNFSRFLSPKSLSCIKILILCFRYRYAGEEFIQSFTFWTCQLPCSRVQKRYFFIFFPSKSLSSIKILISFFRSQTGWRDHPLAKVCFRVVMANDFEWYDI